jgi:hypothetical protein
LKVSLVEDLLGGVSVRDHKRVLVFMSQIWPFPVELLVHVEVQSRFVDRHATRGDNHKLVRMDRHDVVRGIGEEGLVPNCELPRNKRGDVEGVGPNMHPYFVSVTAWGAYPPRGNVRVELFGQLFQTLLSVSSRRQSVRKCGVRRTASEFCLPLPLIPFPCRIDLVAPISLIDLPQIFTWSAKPPELLGLTATM